jgi:hypothetical protein
VVCRLHDARHGYADGSAHRILSDLSALANGGRHRLIVAGDWNLLRGYGEHGDRYWQARYDTVSARAETLGLSLVGPESPNGRQASPWPEGAPARQPLRADVHHNRQSPESATRQLDFVFASTALADRVHVRALNEPENWEPSDHCRVIIDVDL